MWNLKSLLHGRLEVPSRSLGLDIRTYKCISTYCFYVVFEVMKDTFLAAGPCQSPGRTDEQPGER